MTMHAARALIFISAFGCGHSLRHGRGSDDPTMHDMVDVSKNAESLGKRMERLRPLASTPVMWTQERSTRMKARTCQMRQRNLPASGPKMQK